MITGAFNLLHRGLRSLPRMSTPNTEGAPVGSESALNKYLLN
jgi:hypothetical protein